jgi:hypothetical protein
LIRGIWGALKAVEENPMANKRSFSNSICAAETHRAERELSAFIGAVTELFGPEQARVSTEDWFEELTLMDRPSRSKERKWRAVTIAATARLANGLNTATHPQIYSSASTETKASPIASFRLFWFDASVVMRSKHPTRPYVRMQKLL